MSQKKFVHKTPEKSTEPHRRLFKKSLIKCFGCVAFVGVLFSLIYKFLYLEVKKTQQASKKRSLRDIIDLPEVAPITGPINKSRLLEKFYERRCEIKKLVSANIQICEDSEIFRDLSVEEIQSIKAGWVKVKEELEYWSNLLRPKGLSAYSEPELLNTVQTRIDFWDKILMKN